MNFLSIMKAVAVNAGIEVPTTTGSSDADHVKLAEFINESGRELVRRVDWGPLRKTATITGTGTATDYQIAPDFDRLTMGMNVAFGMNAVRGSLTPDEWFSLPPVEGAPRYYYLKGSRLAFYPYLASGAVVRVQYQSSRWVNNGAKSTLEVDSDTAMIPHDLVKMGAVWRWRRHIGKDFADQLAEFEAALVDRARGDSAVRLP